MRRPALARIRILLVAPLLLAACSELGIGPQQTIRYGLAPRIDRLQTLQRGVSTEADVLLALGEPSGRGMARLSPQLAAPNQLWVYELRTLKRKTERQNSLMIFLDGQRYEGYLWFSSKELLDARP
jgi:hypothetical protein